MSLSMGWDGTEGQQQRKHGFMELDNTDIMQYVRMVYDTYEIPDPMKKLNSSTQHQRGPQISNFGSSSNQKSSKKITLSKDCTQSARKGQKI